MCCCEAPLGVGSVHISILLATINIFLTGCYFVTHISPHVYFKSLFPPFFQDFLLLSLGCFHHTFCFLVHFPLPLSLSSSYYFTISKFEYTCIFSTTLFNFKAFSDSFPPKNVIFVSYTTLCFSFVRCHIVSSLNDKKKAQNFRAMIREET